ncbi:hypothetical protein HYALB_00011674 [Hymenoscyphus albidus]|uniref:Fe2OG dioxygenase domain-containing protein n=1 Tax=Hymenoscyphus albidus TaxID=595503 RepID=A0A9N9LX13_9HELO|nr:hypothetical protein HYALB_00011674 [Hymenoscyphus albidus]
MAVQLELLDMSVFKTGSEDERRSFGDKFLKSLKDHGFAKIVNHPISKDKIGNIFQQARSFFSLPLEIKGGVADDPNTAFQRGWSHVGAEKTWGLHGERLGFGDQNSSDSKENFDHGAPDDTQFPNKWPSDKILPGYRQKLEEFYNDSALASKTLLEVLATALNMPSSSFTSRVALNQSSTMRFNHFPEVPLKHFEQGEICRIWPHFDFGTLTLVFRESLGGLEIEDRKNPGSFVPVPCESSDEMLVTVGETLERWTNKELPAGLHRVTKPHLDEEIVNGLVPERYSIAFFCKADRNVSVGPFDEFLVGRERKFEDITAIQYQETRNRATYDKVAVATT